MTINFKGYMEQIVDEAIRRGIVQTKTEALRAGLLELANKYDLGSKQSEEDREIVTEMKMMEGEIRKGRVKTYSKKEFERLAGLG